MLTVLSFIAFASTDTHIHTCWGSWRGRSHAWSERKESPPLSSGQAGLDLTERERMKLMPLCSYITLQLYGETNGLPDESQFYFHKHLTHFAP